MADPMRIRAQVAGDKATVRVLMSHEMETGQRKDASGNIIPAWHIQNVTAQHNGKTVMSAQWGPAVAKNPSMLAAMFDVTDAVDANISTRVKMGQSSDVYAVALMNDGKVLYAKKEVKVTLGGCGG